MKYALLIYGDEAGWSEFSEEERKQLPMLNRLLLVPFAQLLVLALLIALSDTPRTRNRAPYFLKGTALAAT